MFALRHSVAAIGLATACFAATAAGNLEITPAISDVLAGTSFALTVSGSGFTDSVIGGGFNLSFDASRLTLDSLVIDTATWDDPTRSAGLTDNASGTVTDVFFNTNVFKAPGGFNIATLNFTAKNLAGAASVNLLANAGLPFGNDQGLEVAGMSFGGATVNITAVPEPATVISMLMGLALLPTLRRRAS